MSNSKHADQLLPPFAARRPASFLACATRVTTTAVLLAAGTLIGCSSAPPAFDVVADTYEGPPLRLQPTDVGTVLAMQSPTPGWQITLDAVRENFGKQDVFVTVRRPSALFNYPEQPVQQQLATGVSTSTPIASFVRVLPFDSPRKDETPYRAGPSTTGVGPNAKEK